MTFSFFFYSPLTTSISSPCIPGFIYVTDGRQRISDAYLVNIARNEGDTTSTKHKLRHVVYVAYSNNSLFKQALIHNRSDQITLIVSYNAFILLLRLGKGLQWRQQRNFNRVFISKIFYLLQNQRWMFWRYEHFKFTPRRNIDVPL